MWERLSRYLATAGRLSTTGSKLLTLSLTATALHDRYSLRTKENGSTLSQLIRSIWIRLVTFISIRCKCSLCHNSQDAVRFRPRWVAMGYLSARSR